jgi:putative transposase
MSIVINRGTEFLRNGRLYQITKNLAPNRYEARHHKNSEDILTLDSKDINHLVTRGDIEFVTRGLNGKEVDFHDPAGMPTKDRDEVFRRKKYVVTALDYNRIDPSVAHVEKAIEDVAEELSEIVVRKNDKKAKRKLASKKYRKAPSVRTVYRWMKTYIRSGQNIRSLISQRKKVDRKTPIDPRVEKIIDKLINTFYLRSHRITAEALLDEIRLEIHEENKSIPASKGEEPLKVPHINTIYRRINKLDKYKVAKARYGKSYADYKYRVIGKGQEPTRPMEVVQMDHTTLDLFILDQRTRLPLGRPCITTMIDRLSRTICGFHVGFDPPSYLSDMYCMYHAFSSKSYVADMYPNIKNKYLNHGVCEVVIVDNGKDFESNDFKNAASHLGFTIVHSPPREPWHKGVMERFFRTMNTGFVDSVPGSVFSDIVSQCDRSKAGYNPRKDAVLDLDTFLEALHMWIIDHYHQNYHRNLKEVPQKVWKAATEEYQLIQVASINDLHVILGKTYERVIQGNGVIELNGLLYTDRSLVMMRDKYKGQKLTVKVNPADISVIHVHDEALNIYQPVPCVDQEYSNGLSLWQHKVVMRRARENYNKVDRLALAQTRREIEQIIQKAWGKTTVKSMVKGAKYYGVRQQHTMPETVSTVEDQHQYMDDDELLAAETSTESLDFDEANRAIPSNGPVHTDHAACAVDDFTDDDTYDDHDDGDLVTFETNLDPAA